eukprot:jgi/Galph1/1629/GphlegSOOS_G308.1
MSESDVLTKTSEQPDERRKESNNGELVSRSDNFEGRKFWNKKTLRTEVLKRHGLKVCVDVGGGLGGAWDSLQTEREIVSLAKQLEHCCSLNKKAVRNNQNPVSLYICGAGDRLQKQLEISCPMWRKWPTIWTTEDFLSRQERRQDIIYLSYDSPNLLGMEQKAEGLVESELAANKVYVIGGLVDRNRLRGVTRERAKELGVYSARLPIEKYFKLQHGSPVLSVLCVFEILLLKYNGYCWKDAFFKAIPKRKGLEDIGTFT